MSASIVAVRSPAIQRRVAVAVLPVSAFAAADYGLHQVIVAFLVQREVLGRRKSALTNMVAARAGMSTAISKFRGLGW